MAKLAPFIDCLEQHSPAVFQLGDLVRRGGRPLTPTRDPEGCLAGIEAARAKPLLLEVDLVGARFAATLVTVHEQSTQAASAQGDLSRLREAIDEFERAQATLFDLVRELNRQVHRDTLAARRAAEGPTLSVQIEETMLVAEALVATAAIPWDRLELLDRTLLVATLTDLESKAQAMTMRALTEPKEVTAWTGYYNYEHHLDRFLIATRALLQRVHANVAFTDAEKLQIAVGAEADVAGTPGAVIAAYNKLIDMYGVR